MRVVWQCEQDEFCRRVLAKHWPGVPCYRDVRDLAAENVEPVDVLCGGFPCQDLSLAGRRAGIDGDQSGLWGEMFRLTGELRPRYLLVENVPGILTAGVDRVLGDLASIGFDAEWECLPASAFGAPHRRERFWLVAYPGGPRRREDAGGPSGDEGQDEGRPAADDHEPFGDGEGGGARPVAHPTGDGRGQGRPWGSDPGGEGEPEQPLPDVADPDGEPPLWPAVAWSERDPWAAEPRMARMAHGVPDAVDRRRALGNALVPQIAEWIGRRVIEAEQAMNGDVAA